MPDNKERIDLGAELGISESLLNDIKLATESEQQRRAESQGSDKKTTTLQELQKKYIVIIVAAAVVILAVSLYFTYKPGGSQISNSTSGGYISPRTQGASPRIRNFVAPRSNNYQAPRQQRPVPYNRPMNPAPPPPSTDGGYDTDTQQPM